MAKSIRIAIMILLISVIGFPASAYASSKESTSSPHPSFFSSLTSRLASVFTGHMGNDRSSGTSNNNSSNDNHNSNNSSNSNNGNSDSSNDCDDSDNGNGGFWDWLGGRDCDTSWWDDCTNDSNTLWEKYYCY